MRPKIDLTEHEREAIESYADREGYKMERAYAQLLRNALHLRVGVDFSWGESDGFMVVIDTDGFGVGHPVGDITERDGVKLASAEHKDDLEASGIEYGDNYYFDGGSDD